MCLACKPVKKLLDWERPFSLALGLVSRFWCLSCLAPSVMRVVICMSWAFCLTDQETRETACSLERGGGERKIFF